MGGFVLGGLQHAALNLVDQHLSRNALREMIYMDEHSQLIYTTGVVGGDLGLTEFEVQIGGVWYDLDDICNPLSANYPIGLQLESDTPMRTRVTIDPALHNVAPNFHRVDASLTHEITVHAFHGAIWLRKLRSGGYTARALRGEWRSSNLLNPNEEHDNFGLGQNRAYGITAENIFGALGGGAAPFQADVRFDQNAHLPGGAGPLAPPGGGHPSFYI
jgi:hypothetical protein